MKIVGDDKGDWRCPLVAEYVEWMDGCLAGMMAATCFTMMYSFEGSPEQHIPKHFVLYAH